MNTIFAAQHIFDTETRQTPVALELLLRQHKGTPLSSLLESQQLLADDIILLMQAKAVTIRHLMLQHPLHQYFINVSPEQAACKDFIKSLDTFEEHHIPNTSISLEITEHWANVDEEIAISNIWAARKLGFSIIVDDFGSAGMRLSHLATIRPAVVKLDMSLLKNALLQGDIHRKLLLSTVRMLHDIGCKVVAEGVETAELYKIARHAQVDYVQGYFFDKPSMIDLALKTSA
jgi:EAL domain-containing protein (putative c-di-GMP-specific phosphodiesterase class I)